MIKTSSFAAALLMFLSGGLFAKETPAKPGAAESAALHVVYTSSTIGYVDPCG